MSKQLILSTLVSLASSFAAAQDGADVLDAAEAAMGTSRLSSLRYEAGGTVKIFGAPHTPDGPWHSNGIVKQLVVDVQYDQPAMRRTWELIPGIEGPPFGGNQTWLVNGDHAWDVRGNPPTPGVPLFEAFIGSDMAEWRNLDIWLTPPGFIKAAKANDVIVQHDGARTIVSFTTSDGRPFTGYLNAANLLERVVTALANAVMGDMPITVSYADYRRFGEINYPTRITYITGEHPIYELGVLDVDPNGATPIETMPALPPGPLCVGCARGDVVFNSERLGDGVWYLDAGDNFASVVVEFKDYLVVFDAPHNDDRSGPVIAEAHRLAPGKPIRYVVNSHWHFDHLGGARTFAAEGATVLVAERARPTVAKWLNAPRTLKPDDFVRSGRGEVRVEGIRDRMVLTDGVQTLELYVLHLEHSNPTVVGYLPREKVLVSADVQVLPRPGAAPPEQPAPDSLELYNQLLARRIDVQRIAGIHWGRSTWEDLLSMVAKE